MSESKIQEWQRKIRNAERRQKEREQKIIWDKLTNSTIDVGGRVIDLEIVKQNITAHARKLNAQWTVELKDIIEIDGTDTD